MQSVFRKWMLAALLSLSLIQCATAAPQRPNEEALIVRIEELLEFVELMTGLRTDTRPRVLFTTRMVIGGLAMGDAYHENHNVIAAAYGNVIFLPTSFELGRDDDVLVHELVHFVQFATGKDGEVRCSSQLEPEAYRVQDAFRAATGSPVRSDPLTVLSLSLCGDE